LDKITYPVELNPHMSDHAKRASYIREGWYPLVIDLYNKLEAMYPDFVISLVKEKFGKLRVYLEFYPQESHLQKVVHVLIHKAEEKSGTICDVCGEAGEIIAIRKILIATRCDKHLTEGTENWD